MLLSKIAVIDLKLPVRFGCSSRKKGTANEYRENDFCSIDGASSASRVSQMRPSLSRQLQSSKFFMSRPVFGDGVCPTDLSRKSPGYRSLPSGDAFQTLPYGNSWQHIPEKSGSHQRNQRLAYLCRFCSSFDLNCTPPLCRRRLRNRTGSNRLRLRFNYDRSLPVSFSLGQIPRSQSRRQAS